MLALVVVGWGWLLTHPLAGSIEGTDDDVSRWFEGQRTSWLDPVADVGTLLGETIVGLAVGAGIAVVGGLRCAPWPPPGWCCSPTSGTAASTGSGRTPTRGTVRRCKILNAGLVPDHGFPSGHVGTAVAVYGGAALLLAIWLRSRRRDGRRRGRVRWCSSAACRSSSR